MNKSGIILVGGGQHGGILEYAQLRLPPRPWPLASSSDEEIHNAPARYHRVHTGQSSKARAMDDFWACTGLMRIMWKDGIGILRAGRNMAPTMVNFRYQLSLAPGPRCLLKHQYRCPCKGFFFFLFLDEINI